MARRRITLACFAFVAWLALDAMAQQAPPGNRPPPSPSAATPVQHDVFSTAELDQMLAPIALYPDALLAQILMASTYPGDVVDAAKWSKEHPDAKGDAAVKQVANQPWDPSVQSLVAVPQALASLAQDPTWVQRLGDAFLWNPDRVMESVQRLRRQAQQAGNLESNQYQNVSQQPGTTSGAQTIVIDSTTPETVYVPNYNPSYVYGTWGYPGYPPYYYPPPAYWYPGAAFVGGISFGIGIAIGDSLWGDCDWEGGNINIDNDRYNNINTGDRQRPERGGDSRWQHDSARRDGTPYRDNASRERYGKQLDGAGNRQGYRGDTPDRTQARENARQSMDRSGMGSPARSNLEAQDRARQMDRAGAGRAPGSTGGNYQQRGQNNMGSRNDARLSSSAGSGRNDAFSGSRNPSRSSAASSRGRSSASGMSRGGGSRGASRPVSRPPMRGGGGGRRR